MPSGSPRWCAPAPPAGCTGPGSRAAARRIPGHPEGTARRRDHLRARLGGVRRAGVVDLHRGAGGDPRAGHGDRGGGGVRSVRAVRHGLLLPHGRAADAAVGGPQGAWPVRRRPAAPARGTAAGVHGRAVAAGAVPAGPARRPDVPPRLRPGPPVVRGGPAAVLARLRGMAVVAPRPAGDPDGSGAGGRPRARGRHRGCHVPGAAVVPARLHPGRRAARVAVAAVPGVVRVRRRGRAAGRAALVGVAAIGAFAGVVAARGVAAEEFYGGWHWAALATAAAEGLLAATVSVWLLGTAQRHLDTPPGPVRSAANRSAYAAFLLQGHVLIGLALPLRPPHLPAEVKATVVSGVGVVGSFALGWLLVARSATGRVL